MENLLSRLSWTTDNEETEERVELIIHKLKFVASRPSVLFLKDLEPLQSPAGTEVADIVEIAGGALLQLSPAMQGLQDIASLAPEVLILGLQNSSIQQTAARMSGLFAWDGWQHLPAVRNNRVYILDSSNALQTTGAEAVDTLEMFAEIIQPKYFVFGFESSRWVKFGV